MPMSCAYKVFRWLFVILLFFNLYFTYRQPQTSLNNTKRTAVHFRDATTRLKKPYHKTMSFAHKIYDSKATTDQTFANPLIETTNNEQYVLLMNTLGRSGTSWIGELIRQQVDTFYIFEPDYYLVNVVKQNLTLQKVPPILKAHFFCNFSTDFVDWAKSNPPPWKVFRSHFTETCQNITECIVQEDLKNDCKNSSIRIIKTIRVNMQSVSLLLRDGNFRNLKVIFLVRDPRASLLSRQKLGWNAHAETCCTKFEEDLVWYHKIHRQFPANIHLLQYERFCRDFQGEGTKLYRFLRGNSSVIMPLSWVDFLKKHSFSRRKGPSRMEAPYSIARNTAIAWMRWRKEIRNETYFAEIEKHCRGTLNAFGYNIFGALKIARNLSYPALKSKYVCPTIPC